MVQFTGVDVGYDGPNILRGLDFEVRTGEVAFVTGPTSAGKTTFMHLVRLALLPRSGQAIIMGADVQRLNSRDRARVKRKIGYIGENPVFVEDWSGFDNIAEALKIGGKRSKDFTEDVSELIDFVGLGDHAKQPVRELSGAARRRVAIARALAAKPDLILADDPTSGMSPDAGHRVVRLLGEMRKVGAGVIITSQDESLAEWAPGALYRIQNGQLTAADESTAAEA
ncbi:MAG: ATP-binding cassette domain-containing protein [Alphaproteobacteria bacterium]